MALAAARHQGRGEQEREFAAGVKRYAAQFELDSLAAAGRAWIESADVQVRPQVQGWLAREDGLAWPLRRAETPDHSAARARKLAFAIRGRLRMPVRAKRFARQHPDGAVRMVGTAALIHWKRPVGGQWNLTLLRSTVARAFFDHNTPFGRK
jgi:hypothetical protein